MIFIGSCVHIFGAPVAVYYKLCDTAAENTGEGPMTETILYSRIEHVGHLVLNNPQKHNALGREQLEAIHARLDQIAADPEVRVLIVTGTGEKTFCAGAALQELSGGQIGDDAFQNMTSQLAELSIPTICALNGDVFVISVSVSRDVACEYRLPPSVCAIPFQGLPVLLNVSV